MGMAEIVFIAIVIFPAVVIILDDCNHKRLRGRLGSTTYIIPRAT